MNKYWVLPKILCVSLGILVMSIVIWCWGDGNNKSTWNWLSIRLSWFSLGYNGDVTTLSDEVRLSQKYYNDPYNSVYNQTSSNVKTLLEKWWFGWDYWFVSRSMKWLI